MMVIREMEWSDYPALKDLWEPEGMDTDPDLLQRILHRNPGTCWVIEKEGNLIAAALGLFDGRRGFVQSVVVHKDHRHQGHGTHVVRKTIESLRALGTDRIRLFVRKNNETVLEFYQSLGFTVEEGCYYLYDESGTPV